MLATINGALGSMSVEASRKIRIQIGSLFHLNLQGTEMKAQ
jgi:hypothetical protein